MSSTQKQTTVTSFSGKVRHLRSYLPRARLPTNVERHGFLRFGMQETADHGEHAEMMTMSNNQQQRSNEALTSQRPPIMSTTLLNEPASNSITNAQPILSAKEIEEYNYDTNRTHYEDLEHSNSRDNITHWQAAWNITNAIQGMFLVSFPFAVLQGGYWAVFAILFVAYVCCHTGQILVDCLYEETETGEKIRVRNSYVEIAAAVLGARFGGRLVNLAQIIELLMTCILYLVLCGDLMVGSFPNSPLDLTAWIMVASVCLLPCAFLRSLRHVSMLSFWNTVTHLIINAIIIIYCLTRANEWQPSKVQMKIDIWTFPISLGIIVFSYTSQIFLPTLEGNMQDRTKFKPMLYWTHVLAAIFKALFGYLGFVTFGEATEEVITNNLSSRVLKIIVNFALVAKAMLSYPLPYYAAVQLFETDLYLGPPKTKFNTCFDIEGGLKMWALMLRLTLIMFTLFMAIFIPHFAILMGLIGSLTGTMLSFIWPAYFHLTLKRHTLSWPVKLWDLFIIIIGILCGVIGMYYSGHALHRVMRGEDINPFRKNSKLPIFSGISDNDTWSKL